MNPGEGVRLFGHPLVGVSDHEDELIAMAHANRARIEGLEREVERLRGRIHDLAPIASTVNILLEQLRDLAENVKALTNRLDVLAHTAINRPTPAAFGATAAWVAVAISLTTLALAILR